MRYRANHHLALVVGGIGELDRFEIGQYAYSDIPEQEDLFKYVGTTSR
jgi:hypothetical protein